LGSRSHHHFWDLRGKGYDDANVGPRGQVVYGLEGCLEDMCDGHNVTHTVFLQASAGGQFPNWRNASALPEALRPLIEVEICQGIAAKCDAEKTGALRICAAIMGCADFQVGFSLFFL